MSIKKDKRKSKICVWKALGKATFEDDSERSEAGNPGLATVLFLRITLLPGIIYENKKSALRADFLFSRNFLEKWLFWTNNVKHSIYKIKHSILGQYIFVMKIF